MTVCQIPSTSMLCGQLVSAGMPGPKQDINLPAPQVQKRGKDSSVPLPDWLRFVQGSAGKAVIPRGFRTLVWWEISASRTAGPLVLHALEK